MTAMVPTAPRSVCRNRASPEQDDVTMSCGPLPDQLQAITNGIRTGNPSPLLKERKWRPCPLTTATLGVNSGNFISSFLGDRTGFQPVCRTGLQPVILRSPLLVKPLNFHRRHKLQNHELPTPLKPNQTER